ncbi:MAG TPA: hypothetical protein VFO25_00120 [Candidatus Eremiobacteraceae bacterium]|nr:hypothetical protein [Candidatus Eremiobacteraceae bacterium]
MIVLYRPVGEAELRLIERAEWRRFRARLSEQPIFYPVLTEEYARQIARDWSARDGKKGFVASFSIDTDYIRRFVPQQVGARIHTEYWIPATELDVFISHIVGLIEVIASFGGDD